MQRLFICMSVFLMLASQVQAQVVFDTSYWLKDVSVQSNRFETYNAGTKTTQVDSLTQIVFRQQALSDLLMQQSPVFIKSYGPANIGTAAFRGTNAEHTAVMWNGFNLQSGMLGLADLSLMPVDFTDNVQVEHGGNGVLFGSGAIGGAVRLNSNAKFESGMKAAVSLSLGSFGFFRNGLRFSYGRKKWYTSTRAYQTRAENSYRFINTSLLDNPEQTRTHAAVVSRGVQHENYFLLNKKNVLNVRFWYQFADREIPATMSVPVSHASQFDEAVRTSAEWKMHRKNGHSALRVAWFNEVLNFRDLSSSVNSHSTLNTLIAEYENEWVINARHTLLLAATQTLLSGKQENYTGIKTFNRFGLFGTWRYAAKKIKANAGVRQEWADNNTAPLVPFAGVSYQLKKWLQLTGNVSASYRYPTLNERFYNPGGNPQLKSEYGWGEEAGVKLSHSTKSFQFLSSLQGYSRFTDNWIIWIPQGLVTSPRNLRTVWSRGTEATMMLAKRAGMFNIKWNSGFNYTLASNYASVLAADNSVGKQLIYIPRLSQQHSLSIVRKKWFMQYMHQYNGMRYIATDNSSWLNDYYTGSVISGYNFAVRKINLALQLQANNIFNNQYVVLPERPMPGRNFLFTLTFNL